MTTSETTSVDLPGPLAGLRVVEVTNCIGQWCGKLMAALAAAARALHALLHG